MEPRRRGRPPLDNPRRNIERIRTTDDEHALIEAASTVAGTTPAEWMRTTLIAAAKRQTRGR
jgi:hypothetical protein